MIVCLDPGHIGKPAHPADRGAGWKGQEEVALVIAYLAHADARLRALGHESLGPAGIGTYAERIQRAHNAGVDLYVQGHANAGLAGRAGDRGLVIYDHRSGRGAQLARHVAAALALVCPWTVTAAAGRPDDDGEPRDEDLTEAYHCIEAAYPLRPVGLLLEPGFLDGREGQYWLPRSTAEIGHALADGIDAWARSR